MCADLITVNNLSEKAQLSIESDSGMLWRPSR